MRRLYFLVPDADTARKVVDDLLVNHVEERRIHIVARDHDVLKQKDLPEAGVMQERDVIPAIERGIAAGRATGLLAGLAAVTIPGLGIALGGGALLAMAAAGAGFGAFVGPLIGASAPNSQWDAFEHAIRAGQLLMLVDVPKERIEEVQRVLERHHPEVDVGGTEAEIPPFP